MGQGNDPLSIELRINSEADYDELIKKLAGFEYVRVPIVVERGEFSVKGSILDIFPANQTHPLRIEFDFDKIISLRSFDINSQRSLSTLNETEITQAGSIPNFMARVSDTEGVGAFLISDIKPGDIVVHVHHGIGIFRGLQRLKIQKIEGEYLQLEYAGGDQIFVPLNQINQIHRFTGPGEARITSLAAKSWENEKRKAKKTTENIAGELMELYRFREQNRGFAFSQDGVWEIDVAQAFPYKETPDQLKAIKAVTADMEDHKSMDRLICGDVGYGKTEVALRAAFKATLDHKQVAILVPTTLLAQQHYHTFANRFAPFGHKIELLSRFRTPAEIRASLKRLASGEADVAIGTHRLLQKDVQFIDLGLLVIDEEQRFGVKHKEKLKQMRKTVDVLTMSATPIPRTLYMSLSGARDISVINTPPKDRFPIKTVLAEYNEGLIREAVERELARGGQVFFVHNVVQSIAGEANKLQHILPGVRIAIGHGQMPEHQLEKTMVDFLDNKYDVLVCTTIIESGLDIPNTNTIIINNADRFGLAQLHQLRGRVGRSNRQAYNYLLYKSDELLTTDARERLQALKEYTALGAGYQIALRDLEIRGAGNIVGAEQSGHIAAIGFTLFCKLLEESVQEAKGEELPREKLFELENDEYIPDYYIPDSRQRIAVYQRLLNTDKESFMELCEELLDRFGKIPRPMQRMLDSIERQVR
ncbi:MAG: transcription-repair coupling factor [Candidatus Margulisiibacteriota bacterium]|jgi:transcription-repair coupling factor (superfamily II helicase)